MVAFLDMDTDSLLDRMTLAEQRVENRLRLAVQAMESANIRYAVIGAHAVAAWMNWRGLGGVRGTPNVDLMIQREDLSAATHALIEAGFVPYDSSSQFFVDDPDKEARRSWDGLGLRFANERVKPDNLFPHPDVDQVTELNGRRVLSLEPLVVTKLVGWRTIDQVHLIDMAQVRLVERNWCERLPEPLANRLAELFDTEEIEDWVAIQEEIDRQVRDEQMQKNPSP